MPFHSAVLVIHREVIWLLVWREGLIKVWALRRLLGSISAVTASANFLSVLQLFLR